MSQCYRIQLRTAVVRTVKGEDSVSYPIELTELLPCEEMKDLLRQALVDAGWAPEAAQVFVTTGEGGETLRLDLDSMELTASLAEEKEVVAEATAQARGRSERNAQAAAQQLLKEQASLVGDRIADAGTREIQQAVTERLVKSEAARQRRVNELLQKVYTEALKRKAGSLGEILEVQESTREDGQYELLIRIAQ